MSMATHTAYSVRTNSAYPASTRTSALLPASEPNARRPRPPEPPRTPTPPRPQQQTTTTPGPAAPTQPEQYLIAPPLLRRGQPRARAAYRPAGNGREAGGATGSASTSTATTPAGPQITGLISSAARAPPSSQAIPDTAVMAPATSSGPRSGSATMPTDSSVPGSAVSHTRTRGPSRAARPAYAAPRAAGS